MIKNWNLIRIFRVALGVLIVIMGIQEQSWLYIVVGAIFTAMPMMNIGCCTSVPTLKSDDHAAVEPPIIFEEVK